MRSKYFFIAFLGLALVFFLGCKKSKIQEKGFSVSTIDSAEGEETVYDIQSNSSVFETRPNNILLTGNSKIRLTTIYKVNYNKKTGVPFTGDDNFYWNYYDSQDTSQNCWNYHFMPGIEALYGYNLVNISHFDIEKKTTKNFFENPVLIKTFYFPSFITDILNYKPVRRNYFLVSAYDEDSNKDGFITMKDLRRLYYFDINAENKTLLIPSDYSVFKSEYDSANDFMFIFAKHDQNQNGQIETSEPTHIFMIELENPVLATKLY